MGAVYRAYDIELDRIVALKLVRPELMRNPAVLQRFKQELLLASRISHKNILRIHDLGDANGTKFISMACVDGEDLARILGSRGKLPIREAIDIAAQICSALAAAHAEGVVHRDLKPENILIQKGCVYVSDFGLAKSLGTDEAAATAMTMSGEMLGTPRYMSPEQVESKPVDGRSDLYALGLILYEIVTGNVPFHGSSAFHMMLARLQTEPVDPRTVNAEVPEYLSGIILRCLERDPERRYQSAQELLADLNSRRATASAFGPSAPAPAIEPQVAPSGKRSGYATTIAGIVTIAVIIGLAMIARVARKPAPVVSTAKTFYIGVLPLRAIGSDAELNVIAQGVDDSLDAKLFQLSNVRLAPASAAAAIDPSASEEKTAQELGSKVLVEGSVQGDKNRLRIVMSAWDAGQKRIVWSQEFSGVAGDLLTIEDEIFTGLSKALALSATAEEQARAAVHPTEVTNAYQSYLEGRNQLRRTDDLARIKAASASFETAIKADPSFALAYTGLADASLVEYRQTHNAALANRAVNAAERARQLNDDSPEVHITLGSVYNATGKNNEAAAELQQALKLAPNSDEAYRGLGAIDLAANRTQDAYDALNKAVKLNPFFWLNYYQRYLAYLNTGKYSEAEADARKVVELDPSNSAGFEALGLIALQTGRYDEAVKQFQHSLELKPTSSTYSNLGTAYFYLGQYDGAAKAYQKSVEMSPRDQINLGNLADAYRALKNTAAANAAYKKAISVALDDLKTNPRNANTLASLALYYAKSGNGNQAIRFAQRARALNRSDVGIIYDQALVYTLAGEKQQAIASLTEAVQHGYSTKAIESDPEFAPLKTDAGFQLLLKSPPPPQK